MLLQVVEAATGRDEDGGVGGKGSDYADQDNDLYLVLEPQMLAQIVFMHVTLFSIL